MTISAVTLLEPRTAAAPRRSWWPVTGEFLAVGGATLLLLPLGWLLRASLGLDTAELAVGFLTFHAAHVINDPHFAVTYLFFYKDVRRRALDPSFSRAQRARYVLAGFIVPAILALWAASALAGQSAASLGAMLQLMFLLVGWHYVKQGFGVLTVLSARRGVRFTAIERKLVLAHCFAGWAYAWASPADPGRQLVEAGVVFSSLPHPPGLELVTGVAFAASTLALVVVLLGKWRRERRVPPLVALSGFLISVWLWTVYSSIDPLMVYMIPALHSLQYLYFVGLLRRNEARQAEGPPTFGRPARERLLVLAGAAVALGWLLFRGVPGLLDGSLVGSGVEPGDGLGPTPYFAAFFAFVNLHHYFMDFVIWRRENPELRYLLTP